MLSLLTGIFVVAVIGVTVACYLLPTLIGWARHVPHIGSIAAINILLGWTLAGWAVALAMALRSVSNAPAIQVVQQFPPSVPPVLPPMLSPRPDGLLYSEEPSCRDDPDGGEDEGTRS